MVRVSSACDAVSLCICYDVCVSLWCSVAVCLLWCECHEECDAVSLRMICYDACVISEALSLCSYYDLCVISLWCNVAMYLLWCVWPQCVMQCLCVWSALMCVSSECETVSLYVLRCVYHQFVAQCRCVFCCLVCVISVVWCLCIWSTLMCVSSVCDAALLCIFCVCVTRVWYGVSAYGLLWRVYHQFVVQCRCVFAVLCVSSVWYGVSVYGLLWCVYHQFVVQCRCVFAVLCVSSVWYGVSAYDLLWCVYLLSCVCHQCGTVSLHMVYYDVCIISLWCSIAVYFLRCVCHQSVVRCLWHPKLNQMVLGCGDGRVHLYYDPKKSHRSVGSVVWLQLRQSEIFKCSTQEYWFYLQQSWATAVSEVWRWFADGGDLSIYYWRLKWCFVFCFVKCCLKLPSWSGTGMSKFQGQLFIMF